MKDNRQKKNWSRRCFLKASAGAIGGLAAAPKVFGASSHETRPADPKPNFVIFLGEGHRADALSLAGNGILKTPHLDRLGREGMNLPNAFVVNALCSPSRATILTGLYSHTTGAIDNRNRPIPPAVPLLSDLFRQAGYEVACCGKAHVGGGLRDRYWDYYFGFNSPATNYYRPRLAEGRSGAVGEEKVYDAYVDDLVTERAAGWLRQKREGPFCLFMLYQAPHGPFYRARRHLDLYNGIPIPKPSSFDDDLKGYPGKPRAFAEYPNKIGTTNLGDNDPRTLEELVKDYYAGIVAVDESAGSIMETLSQNGQLDNTVVLFTSDHGFFLGEWCFYDKRLMHEPSIRVPMLIRYPKLIKPGLTSESMVLNLDIAPTLLELAGLSIPPWMQGHSMLPLLKGGEADWRKDWLYEYYEYPGAAAARPHRGVRTERYKLIHYYLAPEEFELYDLANDPGELHNLYGEPPYAELATQLRERIEALRKETGDVYEGPSFALKESS
jgi:arylsulfatase A-like enzyme